MGFDFWGAVNGDCHRFIEMILDPPKYVDQFSGFGDFKIVKIVLENIQCDFPLACSAIHFDVGRGPPATTIGEFYWAPGWMMVLKTLPTLLASLYLASDKDGPSR